MNLLEQMQMKFPGIRGSTKSFKQVDAELKELRRKHPGIKRAWMLINRLTKNGAEVGEVKVATAQYDLLVKLTGWHNGDSS